MEKAWALTVCLIVKNEEHCLGECLESIKKWADQIVVVDTGSTDNTIQVARQSGAQIEHFHWESDFAKARNYSLQFATGNWILVVDADEQLAEGMEFLSELKNTNFEGFYVTIKSPLGVDGCVAEDHVVRLFRNGRGYEFTGAIHEQIAGSIKDRQGEESIGFSKIVLRHSGYVPEEIERKQKPVRNSRIIKNQLAKRQNDAFMLYSLGTELIQQGQYGEAYAAAMQALKNMTGGEGYFREVLLLALMASLKNRSYGEGHELFAKALIMMPLDSDILFLSGLRQVLLGNFILAGELFGKGGINTVLVPPQLLYAIVGETFFRQGIWHEAVKSFNRSLQAYPSLYCIVRIIDIVRQGEPEAIRILAEAVSHDYKRLIHEAVYQEDYYVAAIICLAAIDKDSEKSFSQWRSLYQSVVARANKMPAVIKDYLNILCKQMEICNGALAIDQGSHFVRSYLVNVVNRSLGVWLTLWPEHIVPVTIWECCL